MNSIPKEDVDVVIKANDIVEVVSEYVQLKKSGRNYFGLCPFHNENTPSFSVAEDKQIFYCFGCQKGGDVVTYIMEMEGYSFIDAVKYLADRGGVQLSLVDSEKEGPRISDESQNVISAYGWLTKLYHHLLRFAKDGKDGYQYFKNRGISDETIDTFKLGFAPNKSEFTASFLEKKGFHLQPLIKAGVLLDRENEQPIDRFRGRIIFPIRNHLGITVGFGARTLLKDDTPKYLNSAESELFKKNTLLFNFDLAKKHIRKLNEVILFEGYMDVISSYQAGFKNCVATMGTSLTEYQAKLLKRYVDTIIICYDSDRAGQEGAYRAAKILQGVGCSVKVGLLQDGMDPDSFIQEYGAKQFENQVIKGSDTFITFYMRYLRDKYALNQEDDRIRYIQAVLKEIAKIKSVIEREHYLKIIQDEFKISLDALQQELSRYVTVEKREQKKHQTKKTDVHFKEDIKLRPAYHNAERQLLAYMMQDKTITSKVQDDIGARFNIDAHKIIATHLYAFYEDCDTPMSVHF
ncbi:DNA primase [Paracerasibacillus soli]|uniref:DNA primase n=1 Tax=Paracerasibacillus soli TaxID=480284 RepID=A0ABU5CRL9_9BACI|nr:DNA primase [Virgibacillus soli]MDY0408464.1 DNA primase [Virgibacillus soli]